MKKNVKRINEGVIRKIVAESLKNILLKEDGNGLWDFQDDEDLTDDEELQKDRDQYEIERFDNPEFDADERNSEEEYMWQHHGNQNIDNDVEPGWAGMAAQSPDRNERNFGKAVRSSEADTERAAFDDFDDEF